MNKQIIWLIPKIQTLIELKKSNQITDFEYKAFSNLERVARGKITNLQTYNGYGSFVIELRTDKLLNPHWVFSDIHEMHICNGRVLFYVEHTIEDVRKYLSWDDEYMPANFDIVHFNYEIIEEDITTLKIKEFIKSLNNSYLYCNHCFSNKYDISFNVEKYGRLEICDSCSSIEEVSNYQVNLNIEKIIGEFTDRSKYYEYTFETLIQSLREKELR